MHLLISMKLYTYIQSITKIFIHLMQIQLIIYVIEITNISVLYCVYNVIYETIFFNEISLQENEINF